MSNIQHAKTILKVAQQRPDESTDETRRTFWEGYAMAKYDMDNHHFGANCDIDCYFCAGYVYGWHMSRPLKAHERRMIESIQE